MQPTPGSLASCREVAGRDGGASGRSAGVTAAAARQTSPHRFAPPNDLVGHHSERRSVLVAAIVRLLRDDSGQDLVEYALLTAFIGLAGAAAWIAMADRLGNAYTEYDSGVQGLWESPGPGS
jgi:Flp pilus assembly pilin Flp